MANLLSPPPVGRPISLVNGNLPAEWRQWFVNVYRKLGGSEDIDLTGLTASTNDLNVLGAGSTGEVISWDSTNAATNVDAGSAGQVLTSNGGSAVPTFQGSTSTTNALVKLATFSSLNGLSEVVISNLTTAYSSYKLIAHEVRPATDAVRLRLQVSTDNGFTFKNSGGPYSWAWNARVIAAQGDFGNGQNEIDLIPAGSGFELASNISGEAPSVELNIMTPMDSGFTTSFMWHSTHINTPGDMVTGTGSARYSQQNQVNAIRLYWDSGLFADGEITVYGVL